MKKIYKLFTLLLASAFLLSCSGDDNVHGKNESLEDLIVGTWDLVGLEEDGIKVELDQCQKENTKIFFFSDRTAKEQYGDLNKYTQECTIDIWNNDSYKILDGVLFFTTIKPNTELRYKIRHLDENKLVLSLIYVKEGNLPAVIYKDGEVEVLTFKK